MTSPGQPTGKPATPPSVFSAGPALLGWMHEIAPFGVFTTDQDLRVQSWNQWLITHSGRAAADVIGKRLTELYPDLGARGLADRFDRALKGEASVLSTALHRYLVPLPPTAGDPSVGHMLQTAMIAPLPAPDGAAAGTIAIIEDVTQREVQAVALHRQQEIDRLLSGALASLLQSREPAQEIGKIFSTLILALRLDIYLVYLPSQENRRLVLTACAGLLPRQQEAIASLVVREAGAAKGPALDALSLNIGSHAELLRGMGVRGFWSTPLVISERLVGMVAFGSYEHEAIPPADVTVLSRLAGYIAIALDRASREREMLAASKAKDNFLAALSHELRTPLNPVLLLASEAKANPDYPPDARATFRSIEKNVLLEARLIDDLLDLTRIAHGKVGLDMREHDIHAVITDAVATIRPELEERKLNFHLELAPGPSLVLGDSARLQQVFWNILKNSVKFTPAAGSVWVRTTINAERQEIAIEIADTGIGMDEAEIERIFDAFTQGDHAEQGHRFGGLGLGLAITRTLVSMHRGRIEAQSLGKNRGSSFWIYLPLLPVRVERQQRRSQSAAPEPGSPSVAPFAGRRILLVEDHESTRHALYGLLRRRGFDVTVAATSEAAMEQAAKAGFDLVLSDIGLPDGDGFALMARLRDQYNLRGIALTGYGMEEDIVRSGDSGFITHLTKPVSVDVLERALTQALPGVPPAG
jgi:signal transduction histidine kinase